MRFKLRPLGQLPIHRNDSSKPDFIRYAAVISVGDVENGGDPGSNPGRGIYNIEDIILFSRDFTPV